MIALGQTHQRGSLTITIQRVMKGPLGNEVYFTACGTTYLRSEATIRKWLAGEKLTGKQRMPRIKKRNETALVKAAIDYLTAVGCFVWRNNTGATQAEYEGRKRFIQFGKVGSGDIIGMTPTGRFISVECKVAGNKPTDHQLAFAERVRQHGGIALVVYDLDELERQYKEQA